MWMLFALFACVGDVRKSTSVPDTGASAAGDSAPNQPADSGDTQRASGDSVEPEQAGETGEPPDTGPAPVEDCGNGVDDDGDGLLDCEDDACEGAEVCVETDCANGRDDDDDGLEDCEDDDCWSAACEDVAWARVTGGRLMIRETSFASSNHPYGGDEPCSFGNWERSGAKASWQAFASGTVQFVQSGELKTCDWATLPAWASRRHRHATSLDGSVARLTTSGGALMTSCRTTVDNSVNQFVVETDRVLSVEEGCGLTRTDFLPPLDRLLISAWAPIKFGAQVNTVHAMTWYKGAVTYTYQNTASSRSGFFDSSYAWFGPLAPTDAYQTEP